MGYLCQPIYDKKQAKRDPRIPDDLPSPPFAITCLAKRMSGKTAVLAGLIEHVYAKVFKQVIILSNTASFDSTIQALAKQTKHKNILVWDDVSNKSIAAIVKAQEDLYAEGKKEQIMLLIDDAGDSAQGRDLSFELSRLYTRSRHQGISFCMNVQSISSQLSRKMKTNTSHWIIYKASADDFKIMSKLLASAFLTEKDVFIYLTQVTAEQYAFAFIDTLAKTAREMYRYHDAKNGFMDYFES